MGRTKTINCLSLVISLILIFTIFFNAYACGDEDSADSCIISGAFQKSSDVSNKLPYVYSDAYFKNSSSQYNSSLSTMSLCLELSAFANKGNVGTDYQHQSKNVKELLTNIGFQDIQVNQDFEIKSRLLYNHFRI